MYHSEYLHNGTNNEAELWALLLVLRSLCNVESLLNVQIFTDSLYAMNMALGEWIPRHNLDLISNVQSALELLRVRTSVNILWVPGHANIPENEMVDLLAKRGAAGCTSSLAPSDADIARHRENMHPSEAAALPSAPQRAPTQPGASVIPPVRPPRRRSSRLRKRTNCASSHEGVDYSMI